MNRKRKEMVTSTRINIASFFLWALLLTSYGLHAAAPPVTKNTVEEAVKEALANNRELAVERAEMEMARSEWITAKTLPFNPEIEAELERGGDNFSSSEEKSTMFGVSQELELFGQRGRRKAAARYRWDAAKARIQRAETLLAAEVSKSFQKLLYLQKREDVFQEVSKFDKEVRDASYARYKEEKISRLTFDLAQIEYNQFLTELAEVRSELMQETLSFLRLLGRNPDQDIQLNGDLSIEPLHADIKKLESYALRHRKDYLEREMQVKAATQDLSLAKRERLPNPKIGLIIGQETGVIDGKEFVGRPSIIDGIDRVEQNEKRVGLNLSFPLPLFNRNQGEISRAKAEIRVTESSLDDLKNRIRTEVRQAHARLQAAEKVVDIFQAIEPRLSKDLALVRKAYKQGRIPIEDYLTQKDRFIKAKLDTLNSLEQYFSSRYDLEKAIGARLEQATE